MKRFSTLLTMALMAVLSLTFTSCDEDAYIADTLEGTWKGNMYVSSQFNGRTYDATYTELSFVTDPFRFSSGTGYWVDFYSGGPYDYVANHIRWTVSKGIIYVHFIEEGTDIQIMDYYLDNGYFSGTIYDGHNRVRFRMGHTSSPNWDYYEYGYVGHGYVKRDANFTRSANGTAKAAAPVRFIRAK